MSSKVTQFFADGLKYIANSTGFSWDTVSSGKTITWLTNGVTKVLLSDTAVSLSSSNNTNNSNLYIEDGFISSDLNLGQSNQFSPLTFETGLITLRTSGGTSSTVIQCSEVGTPETVITQSGTAIATLAQNQLSWSPGGNTVSQMNPYYVGHYGLSYQYTENTNISTTITLTNASAVLQQFDGTIGTAVCRLPNTTTLVPFRYFIVYVNGSGQGVQVQSAGGTNMGGKLGPGATFQKYICINTTTDASTSWISASGF